MGGLIYGLEYSKSKQLEEVLKQTTENLEPKLNNYLGVAAKDVMSAIVGFMPVSNREKQHAKNSNSLAIEKSNLAFMVYAKGGAANKKGSFGYLVFPNEGRGAHNPVAQEFFQRGLESKQDKIFSQIMKIITECLEIKI